MKRKVLFIVNPASRGGASKAHWQDVRPVVETSGVSFDYAYTEAPEDAMRLAQKARESGAYDVVASFGGDGTANEVINGLLKAGPSENLPAFTIFPSGTGSDSVRTLGITKDMSDFLKMLDSRASKEIDVGIVNYKKWGEESEVGQRYFLNACDLGIGATVANVVNGMNKDDSKKSGKGKYFRSIMDQVFKFKAFDATVEQNGEAFTLKKTVIIAICNGMFFGGGVKISPISKMDDGILELVASKNASKLGLLNIVSKVYTGSHVDHPKVQFQRSQSFCVKLEKPQLLETDGEVLGKVMEANFGVKPGALKVIC